MTLFSTTLCLLACGGTEYIDDSQPIMPHLQNFEAARAALDREAAEHENTVTGSDAVSSVTLAEVHWGEFSSRLVDEMSASIRAMGFCTDANGGVIDVEGARAALGDLRSELGAHKLAMLTITDTESAHALEQVFDLRQDVLVQELRAHFEAFKLVADTYACAF